MKEKIKKLKITAPEGYEIDKENSTFENIVFKPIQHTLPRTWGEFCKTHTIKKSEVYISTCSHIISRYGGNENKRDDDFDKNIILNKKTAEAFIALMQLIQLRDCYNGNWKPNWNNGYILKYSIYLHSNKVCTVNSSNVSRVLTFKTEELRDQFLENFKDLIEIAKPLI